MSLTETEGCTIADLERLVDLAGDDGHRYELIGGSIVVNPAPRPRHQIALLGLARLLDDACPTDHTVLVAPVDLDLPGGQRVEPDLLVVPHASIGELRVTLPVLLVVELVSPSTAKLDLSIKPVAYAEAGVPHYWLLDTREGQERFTALALPAGGGDYDVTFDSTERVEPPAPVAVSASLASVFEP